MGRYATFDPDPHPPLFAPPALTCDSHFHVFGARAQYPVLPGIEHDMPEATFAALRRLHAALGITRGVICASTVNGSDHQVVLDALAALGPAYRACALFTVLEEQPDLYIQRLHDAGVRGVRFNLLKMLNRIPSPDRLQRALDRLREIGWYCKVQPDYDEPLESLAPFEKLEIPVIIDHMARAKISEGATGSIVRTVSNLLRRGNFWLLLANGYKVSKTGFPWDDVVPVARAFIEAAPDRVLWGSDWPHTFHTEAPPNDGDLFNFVARVSSDEQERQKLLVDNPAALFFR
ncbi:MAG: amidohydrolase family protein [Pseudomonadota bacterium]